VRDNLFMGAHTRRVVQRVRHGRAFTRFRASGSGSGDRRHAFRRRAAEAHDGRALLPGPARARRSLVSSPLLVETIFTIIREINSQGTPVLLVEQNANKASRTHGYVLETGAIVQSGMVRKLLRRKGQAYLGMWLRVVVSWRSHSGSGSASAKGRYDLPRFVAPGHFWLEDYTNR
jgi:branched-chain amino acid transport system ATP-binding protein